MNLAAKLYVGDFGANNYNLEFNLHFAESDEVFQYEENYIQIFKMLLEKTSSFVKRKN